MRWFVSGGYSRKMGWEVHGWRNSERDTEFRSRSFKETKAYEKSRCEWMDNVKMAFGVGIGSF